MSLEQRRQAMLQLHMSDQHVNGLPRYVLYWRFDGGVKNWTTCKLFWGNILKNFLGIQLERRVYRENRSELQHCQAVTYSLPTASYSLKIKKIKIKNFQTATLFVLELEYSGINMPVYDWSYPGSLHRQGISHIIDHGGQ